MRSSRKTLAVVLLVVWIIVSIYVTAHNTIKLRSLIDTLGAQGNKVADMADECLDARNKCLTKLRMCEDAKMEIFYMYTTCEEEIGELKRGEKR